MRARTKTKPGGRPPKFDEPRRPVTLTLPERTLRQLAAIDDDRARAIVKASEAVTRGNDPAGKPVEIVEVSPGKGIILVGASRCLRQIPWLRLAEIVPGRYLLIIESGTAIEGLELSILDLIESLPPDDDQERSLLNSLVTHLRTLRREHAITKAEMLFVRTGRAKTNRF